MALLTGSNFFFFACKTKEEDDLLEFYYYPEKNVYYSPAKNLFYYSVDGAKSWDSIAGGNPDDLSYLGAREVIETDSSRVFVENAKHRKLYGGTLLDVVSGDTSVATAVGEVSERKILKKRKVAEQPDTPETKPKKGIRKLFDKIFGKHEKK